MGSCIGCKFLYRRDSGYSNWTVLDTEIHCAKDKNPNLPAEEPYDWNQSADNWPNTMNSKCGLYAHGDTVTLDVDGDVGPADSTEDEEAILAICQHSGVDRNGGWLTTPDIPKERA